MSFPHARIWASTSAEIPIHQEQYYEPYHYQQQYPVLVVDISFDLDSLTSIADNAYQQPNPTMYGSDGQTQMYDPNYYHQQYYDPYYYK